MNTELTPIKYVSVMSLDEKGSTFKVDSITLKLNDGKKKELSIQTDIPDLYKEMEKGLGKGSSTFRKEAWQRKICQQCS